MARSRLVYLGLLIAAFIFSQALYDSISLFTLAVVLMIPLISLICLLISLLLVKIEPGEIPQSVDRLSPFSISVIVRSKTPLMLPMMRFNVWSSNAAGDRAVRGYTVVNYAAFGKTGVEIPMRFTVRGAYRIGVESVVFYDFLRLFRIRRRVSRGAMIAVKPRLLRIDLPVNVSRLEQETTSSVGGHETRNNGDIAGIREFTENDTIRQIHWQLSARISKMIVKTYWENTCDNVMVLADLFPYEEELLLNRRLTDSVVEIAMETTSALADESVRMVLGYPNYDDLLFTRRITTPEEQMAVSDELAMSPMMKSGSLQESFQRIDFPSLQGGALYIITSMPAEKVPENVQPYLSGVNCAVQYLVVRPEAEEAETPGMRIIPLAELEKDI